ncbi:MAG: OmpH family outer membrane protein [Bacteroidales bacterium]|jgi:outer membrane protein|nr:OmpH family outer membrane protein [Bacteroidales bacterium]
MKKLPLILSIVALVGVIVLAIVNFSSPKQDEVKTEAVEVSAEPGAIVYFDLDRVMNEYDMANDLLSVFESKANSINEEVTRRGTKLEKDVKAFQDKINKGLLTQSVAERQSQTLSEQQANFQNYYNQKQQEIAEEQQVMMNQIADAINTFVNEFNAEKNYAMIIATQGAGILPTPVVTGNAELDITDELLEGLNAAYIKSKENK